MGPMEGVGLKCVSCGTQLAPGAKFCMECGTPQALSCPACASPVHVGQKFCMECGTGLTAGAAAQHSPTLPTSGVRAERRLVSVLFADLVSFTTLSEHRDPEAMRDMLERYFERCRTVIARYGGVVEKFIGDAVMAVWGTPVAREDDAERAVRAGLDLVATVLELGEQLGMPELRVRAGLVTGESAVNVGAEHAGMVIGDAVNTASRIQSLAEPSTVLVDDATHRATERAVQYEDAGTHEVKGREQLVHVHKALRVLGGVGGSRRGSGLEPPFVGRDQELRTIISAVERVRTEGRAQQVVVLGEAWMGKSRLAWELEKYLDGIADVLLWHRGRCLSYGEGVSFWALADVVRMRARIAEAEAAESARAKLRATVEEYVEDERERRLVLPRLEHLLGLAERGSEPGDLFSGWRVFFERMAAVSPVVMVLEDLQWADNGLLGFIDYLMEWSEESPIMILALARPEALERRPQWAAQALRLEPLGEASMDLLLLGLIPGLPADAVSRIRARAEGIPLYAVETVRMMLDRGLLAQDGDVYVLTGDVGDIEVPETLHALVAARLDGLSAAERRLVQDASVLGRTFAPTALAELAEMPEREVEVLLAGLVEKQIFQQQRDPTSPEHGQFGFMQALLKSVAYGTLGRRDRKARHLAAAHVLQRAFGDAAEEYAEVLASHLEEAIRADPDASDVASLQLRASDTLAEAGRRALSLGLGSEARRWFERAADLAADPVRKAALLDLAGRGALLATDPDAGEPFERAAALLEEAGQRRAALVVRARGAETLWQRAQFTELADVLRGILDELGTETIDGDVAFVAGLLARAQLNSSDARERLPSLELALAYAERAGDWPLFADLLITRGATLETLGRPREGEALMRYALDLSLHADLWTPALRAYNNLCIPIARRGDHTAVLELADAGLELAERAGSRQAIWHLHAQSAPSLIALGRWDEAISLAPLVGPFAPEVVFELVEVHHARGDAAAAREAREFVAQSAMDEFFVPLFTGVATAADELAQGDPEVALAALEPHVETFLEALAPFSPFALALDAAIALGRPEAGEGVISRVLAAGEPWASPARDAHIARFRGRVARARDDVAAAEVELDRAVDWARESGEPFLLARCLLELGEMRMKQDRFDDAQPLLVQASELFAGLRARPWEERADAALSRAPSAVA